MFQSGFQDGFQYGFQDGFQGGFQSGFQGGFQDGLLWKEFTFYISELNDYVLVNMRANGV